MMNKEKNKHRHHHVDESEKFKLKSLMVRKNRKKISSITYIIMWVVAVIVIAAIIFAYYLDK